MEDTVAFLGYLAAHRAMMFVAGTISIVLGYRLLIAGLQANILADGKTPEQVLSAEVGVAKFSMRNLAPGTAFAFFGAAMLTAMAIHRPPEISIDNLGEGKAKGVYRGDQQGELVGRAMSRLRSNDRAGALALAQEASQAAAGVLNNSAWVFVKAGGNKQTAIRFAEAAVSTDEANANYLDTLAQAHLANENRAAAVEALERASRLDRKYQAELDRLKALDRTK